MREISLSSRFASHFVQIRFKVITKLIWFNKIRAEKTWGFAFGLTTIFDKLTFLFRNYSIDRKQDRLPNLPRIHDRLYIPIESQMIVLEGSTASNKSLKTRPKQECGFNRCLYRMCVLLGLFNSE